jgi:very-short-patch-repair endonuclease
MARERVTLDTDDLVRRYVEGASENQLAKELGVSRSVVARRLAKAGVERRGRSDAERLKWASLRTDRTAVERQCGAAWNATRGRVKSDAEKAKAARTNFLNATRIGRGEDRLATGLTGLGLTVEQQFPCGPYNVDVAVREGAIAVEIMGTWPKANGTTPYAERVEHILNAGWLLLWVDIAWGKPLRVAHVAKYVLAWPQFAGRHEAVGRGQWVIRGDAEDTTTMGVKLHKLTGVPCPQATIEAALD